VLAVGKPSVMVGPADAECSRIVSESGAGIVVDNGDAIGLVRALRTLHDDRALREEMGRRARAVCEERYHTAVACGRIEEILKEVVARR
jgi:glycosyltransferase involved in cell wall biosynthesis